MKYKVTLVRDETYEVEAPSMAAVRTDVDRKCKEDPSIVDTMIEEVK